MGIQLKVGKLELSRGLLLLLLREMYFLLIGVAYLVEYIPGRHLVTRMGKST